MELFKLLGTIAIDNTSANKALEETSGKAKDVAKNIDGASESGEKSGSKFGNAMSKMGTAAVKVAKVVGTGMIAAGTAVAGLVTQSVKAYADYEQLVGGVETLFNKTNLSLEEYAASVGKSTKEVLGEWNELTAGARFVVNNARNAYKTAGMSANAYMETVTSFSASLLQSLGGDTVKAASYADRAIIDMSDNANKMGTDISMIQNAYQGFAKQNYTMLDNLKLGYGGTQEEMKRLIADAAKMTDIQKEMGITVDANSMSFGNIVNAISVMQEKMGIAGATAAEASTTISGSINSMKAAWTNLTVAMSDDNADFSEYVNYFVESVSTVADNLMPRISIALEGVVQLIDQLAPVIIGKIPELVSQLLPAIVNAATGIINGLVSAFPGVVSALIDCLPTLIKGFRDVFNGLIEALPEIIQAVVDALPILVRFISNALEDVFITLCTMLPQMIQPIIEAIPRLVELLVGCLLDSVWGIMDGIMELVTALIDMLPTVIPMFVDAITEIVRLIVAYLPDIIPELVDAMIQIIGMLAEQLPVLIPMLVDALVQIVTMLTEQLPTIIPMLIDACIQITTALVEALPTIIMALVEALPAILQAVWDAIVMVFQNLPEWFGQIFDGIVNIIASIFPGAKDHIMVVWDAIKNYFSTVVNSIKDIISTAWNSIKDVISTVIDSIKNVISTVWESIKTIIKNVMNIIFSVLKGDWESVRDSISNIINAIWDVIKSVWDGIKNTITSVIRGIKDTISSYFNGIKDIISSVIDGIKNIATSKFNAIKEAMTKPVENARDLIKGIIDKIKGFFSGMKLEFPNIKLPHFGISPSGWKIGDLLKGSIPRLSIDWYAKAMENPMIMTKPTIFGYDGSTGQLMGGGEAGSEVVSGTNTLMQMIQSAVAAQNDALAYYLQQLVEMLADYFPQILEGMDNPRPAVFDPNQAALALAAPMNYQLGRLSTQKGRGR